MTRPITVTTTTTTVNCYKGSTTFVNPVTLPVAVGDVLSVFNVPSGAVVIFPTAKGTFRANAALHKITGRYDAAWVDWEDNLSRDARVFIQRLKKDGSIATDWDARRNCSVQARPVEWRYNASSETLVKVVSI